MLTTSTSGARMSTTGAIRLFLRYSERFADNTRRQYRDVLYRFSDAMPPLIKMITAEHIDRYVGSLKILNSSKNTVLVPIKSFFSYLANFYDLPNVAAKVKNLPPQPAKRRVISEIEYRKLLETAKPKEGAIIKFLANTGLRVQEFCDLTPDSVSNDQKYITVIGKGNRQRIVPLNKTAIECLPLIFSRRYNRDSISWIMKKLSLKAKIPLFYAHALRHYWVTAMIKKGVNRFVVAKIAGHSVEVLEKIYFHLLTPDFLGCTDVLDE